MTRKGIGAALAVIATLTMPAIAAAHVEIEPTTAPGGDLAHLTLQVPNESEAAATTSVSVQIPDKVVLVRFAPKPGWKRTVVREKLAQTSTVGEDVISERVSQVTWSGGKIAPGEFETFDMSVALPDEPDTELTFPAVQRYDDGTVVRWIGAEDSDEPAPRLTITAAEEGQGHGATTTTSTTATSSSTTNETHASDGKSNAALGFGIAGLVAGLGALVVIFVRRKGGTSTPS